MSEDRCAFSAAFATFSPLSPHFAADRRYLHMRQIILRRLDGIPQEWRPDLFDSLRFSSNGTRLLISMFFLSDMPQHDQTLDKIEGELRSIFPPSIPHNFTPADYQDFAASALRGVLNRETALIKSNHLSSEHRLWNNPLKGCWRNTDLGNAEALIKLRRLGFEIVSGDKIVVPEVAECPTVSRPYMEEAEEKTARTRAGIPETPIDLFAEQVDSDYLQSRQPADIMASNLVPFLSHALSVLNDNAGDHAEGSVVREITLHGSRSSILTELAKIESAFSSSSASITISRQNNRWDISLVLRSLSRISRKI